ncbi:cytochrome c oxidase assembly factor 3, mitochondrial [Cephus cinctus]|uniref:Cytochrome c oxidase assembly factor 3 n=1 Tax=Cephus cinctus TaxID=211228 RepID=A0AAJ7FEK7_CEPCN|nr:cytochrome c oxidase assembly factor 3, mitochondrial [Cephus cinctus]
MDEERMPKLNPETDARKISSTDAVFMKLIEEQNLERVQKLKKVRRKNLMLGSFLGLTAIGIYAYSMISIKQEKFLDDFDEPEKVSN